MKLSTTTLVAACAAFTLIAAGCGGDDGDAGGDTTVAAAVNDTDAPSEESTETDAPDTESTEAPETETTDATETETTEALVEETPGADPVYVDGQAPPERTITIVDGAFEPAELTIAAGETVTFVTEEGIYGVIVGGLDGYTVTTGLFATFQFDAPGTYPVREDISGNTATVTVSG